MRGKRRELFWFIFAANSGYIVGSGESGGWRWESIVWSAIVVAAIIWLAIEQWKEIRDDHKEAEDERVYNKATRDSMFAAANASRQLMSDLIEVGTTEQIFHTKTGREATPKVKERAYKLFILETNADLAAWNGQPEFARESWYRAIEEAEIIDVTDPITKGAEL